MEKIRWGIFGASHIAHKFCRAKKPGEIAFVSSSDKARAKNFARTFGIKDYGSYEEMLSDKSINAVYVCGSNEVHFGHCKMALNSGKNVLVEKPATICASDWQELVFLAKQKNVLLMEAIWSLFLPTTIALKKEVEKLGKISSIESSFCRNFLNKSHRVFKIEKFGGVLYDLGVYNVHICNYLMQSCGEVASAEAVLNEEKVDTTTKATLKYNDASATILTSSTQNAGNFIKIYGENGWVYMPRFWSGAMLSSNILGKTRHKIIWQKLNGFHYEITHFENLILDGKKESDVASFDTTLNSLKIIDAILERVNYGQYQQKQVCFRLVFLFLAKFLKM